MKYIFKININTDGDFGFDFVPTGMIYDGFETFTFETDYPDIIIAKERIITICKFLKEHIRIPEFRDYVKKQWDECVDEFIEKIYKLDNPTSDEMVISDMSGNYAETEFYFYAKTEPVTIKMYDVTHEERELIKRNKDKVTSEMLKEAVLTLYREV